jgi:hypothetical protein
MERIWKSLDMPCYGVGMSTEKFSPKNLIRLRDVGEHLPSSRRGKRLSLAVLHRWASIGVRGAVLHTVKIGGCRWTTHEWIINFIEAQNPHVVLNTSNTDRERHAKKTEEELSRRGV